MNDLKAARKRAGLTQKELAGLTGYSLSSIKAMENNFRKISLRIRKWMEGQK